MKKVPYDHQLEALLKMTSRYNEGFLIADDPGLGKTLTCLMLIKIRYRYQLLLKQKGLLLNCKPCLVVVPVSAIAIWNKEALDLFPNQDEIYIHYGRKRNEEEHLTLDMIRKTALVITTHNTVQSDGIDILCDKFPLFECVFVDEGHILHGSSALTNSDQSTKRRKKGLSIADSIMALKKRSQVRYVVTGTPFRNEVSDLRLIRYFVDDNFDKETLFYPVEDVEKDAELKNWMNDHMIRRRKEDVLPSLIQQTGSSIGLREKKFFTHSLDFNEFEALNMKNLRQILATRNFANGDKKFVSYKEPVLTNKSMSIWMKMRQCCISYILASKEGQEWINKQHLFLDRPANEEDILKTNDIITKSTKLQRILQDLKKLFDAGDASEKGVGPVVVLISHFVTALKLVDILIKRNASFFQNEIDTLFFVGDMNIAQREEVLKLASQTKKSTLLLVSIASGNACVDMTFSTDFLFLDRWWTPATEFQMQERGHRFVASNEIDKRPVVNIHYYMMRNSVEDFQELTQSRKYEKEMDFLGDVMQKEIARAKRELLEQKLINSNNL